MTERAARVQLYLEYVPEDDIPWSEYYLGLSGVGALLVSIAWLDVYPFGGLGGVELAAILVGLLAVSGAVHRYQSRSNRLGGDEFEVGP